MARFHKARKPDTLSAMDKTKAARHVGRFFADHLLWELLIHIAQWRWAVLLIPALIAIEHHIKHEPQNVVAVVAGLVVSVLGIFALRENGWLDRRMRALLPVPQVIIEFAFTMAASAYDKDAKGQVDYNLKASKPLLLRNLGDVPAIDIQVEPISSQGYTARFDLVSSLLAGDSTTVLARLEKSGNPARFMGDAKNAFAKMFLGFLLEGSERIAYNESDKITDCAASVTYWEPRKRCQFVSPVTFHADGNSITVTQGEPYEKKNV